MTNTHIPTVGSDILYIAYICFGSLICLFRYNQLRLCFEKRDNVLTMPDMINT